MPTNVTPQYREAERRFREAPTIQTKIASLQEMLSVMPKHKGTDHLKAQLRARLSKLMKELEDSGTGGGGGRTEPFSLPKEGGGRATLIGTTNVGKSLILKQATGAKTKVGSYNLSTQEPLPGMLTYEDMHVQLVDTPPISNPTTQSRLYGLLRTSDVFVIVVDLSMEVMVQIETVFSALGDWDFHLSKRGEQPDNDNPWKTKATILVGNKADIPGALDQYQILEDEFASTFPVVMVSATEDVGFEEVAFEVFQALKVIRVYTKAPRKKLEDVNKVDPLVLPIDSTVADAAEQVHRELGKSVKYAILWGDSGKFTSQRVGRHHLLSDGDIIEIHT